MLDYPPIRFDSAPPGTRETLCALEDTLGRVPNLLATLAHSPAALRGYVALREALCAGALSEARREQIALRVAELTASRYGVAAHAALGALAGLGRDDVADGRRGYSPHPAADAALQFAERLVLGAGCVDRPALERLAASGWTRAQVLEIAATTALSLLESYVASITAPEVDFPAPPCLATRSPRLSSLNLDPGG